jgi:hypothetical protein
MTFIVPQRGISTTSYLIASSNTTIGPTKSLEGGDIARVERPVVERGCAGAEKVGEADPSRSEDRS